MYRLWCQPCHGANGTGRFEGRPVRTTPLDFSDCRVATPEPDADWELAIRAGGPAVGLSADMPSFEMLSIEQVRLLIVHLRSFCQDPGWPHGNMNVPRALFTRKAFPENEIILQPVASHSSQTHTQLGLQVSLERRLGRRMHVSAEIPFYSVLNAPTPKTATGDVAIGAKRVVIARPDWPLIATAGASLSFPSGDRGYGFGSGTHILWPYLAAASFHDRWYFQADIGVQIHMPKVEFDPIRLLMYNAALTRDLTGSPTTWNIGLEVNGIDGGLGLVPQIRKGLTRSGTLSAALGFRIPVRPHFPFAYDTYRWRGYLLWEPLPRPSK